MEVCDLLILNDPWHRPTDSLRPQQQLCSQTIFSYCIRSAYNNCETMIGQFSIRFHQFQNDDGKPHYSLVFNYRSFWLTSFLGQTTGAKVTNYSGRPIKHKIIEYYVLGVLLAYQWRDSKITFSGFVAGATTYFFRPRKWIVFCAGPGSNLDGDEICVFE